MGGITGWYSTGVDSDRAEAVVSRMTAVLPPGDAQQTRTFQCGALGISGANSHINFVDSPTIHAAIEGTPIWKDQKLQSLAEVKGNARALLEAYRDLGLRLFKSISGSYALAIVDLSAKSVTIAVDRMGIRPMCYATTPNSGIVFGTCTRSILANGSVCNTISPQAVYDYVYFHVVPSPLTVYKSIRKLEPGQYLHFHQSGFDCSDYWSPEFRSSRNSDYNTLAAEVLPTVRKAVWKNMTIGSTGAFLSGGLDSSTVCGVANENSPEPLPAYTIGFAQRGYDETQFAKVAAGHFGLELRDYYVTPEDIIDAIPIIAASFDEPFGNSSAVPAYFCAVRAKADGIRTLLAGDGGDELFGGNERYATQRLFEYYAAVPKAIRSLIIEPALFGLPTEWSVLTRKARRYVEQAIVSMPERLQTYNFLFTNKPSSVFEESFLAGVDQRHPANCMQSWYDKGENFSFLNRMLMFDWKLTLADNDIRKVNRMCEVVGVMPAYPLLDDEVVQFSEKIPAELKIKGRNLRFFFKKSLSGYLPKAIIHKKKHGFGLPFGEWLKGSSELRELVSAALASLADREIFLPEFIDEIVRRHQSEHAAYYGNIIWVLVMLEYWLDAP